MTTTLRVPQPSTESLKMPYGQMTDVIAPSEKSVRSAHRPVFDVLARNDDDHLALIASGDRLPEAGLRGL